MKQINIFTQNECPYCNKLMGMLDKEGIDYIDLNINNDKNNLYFEKIVKVTDEDSVPTIVVGTQIIAPNKSFSTIDQAFEIIKNLMG